MANSENDDEYLLVRAKDKAIIMDHLYLNKGFGCPHGKNFDLAHSINGWLKLEKDGGVSFAKLK